jgi:hypothetical protein
MLTTVVWRLKFGELLDDLEDGAADRGAHALQLVRELIPCLRLLVAVVNNLPEKKRKCRFRDLRLVREALFRCLGHSKNATRLRQIRRLSTIQLPP